MLDVRTEPCKSTQPVAGELLFYFGVTMRDTALSLDTASIRQGGYRLMVIADPDGQPALLPLSCAACHQLPHHIESIAAALRAGPGHPAGTSATVRKTIEWPFSSRRNGILI
jgi:hypothetical protein